jgi:hypothetical protein
MINSLSTASRARFRAPQRWINGVVCLVPITGVNMNDTDYRHIDSANTIFERSNNCRRMIFDDESLQKRYNQMYIKKQHETLAETTMHSKARPSMPPKRKNVEGIRKKSIRKMLILSAVHKHQKMYRHNEKKLLEGFLFENRRVYSSYIVGKLLGCWHLTVRALVRQGVIPSEYCIDDGIYDADGIDQVKDKIILSMSKITLKHV